MAFALSGLIESARKRLDVVGIFMVMGLSAFGGGTLRDILLDRRPFCLAACCATWCATKSRVPFATTSLMRSALSRAAGS